MRNISIFVFSIQIWLFLCVNDGHVHNYHIISLPLSQSIIEKIILTKKTPLRSHCHIRHRSYAHCPLASASDTWRGSIQFDAGPRVSLLAVLHIYTALLPKRLNNNTVYGILVFFFHEISTDCARKMRIIHSKII